MKQIDCDIRFDSIRYDSDSTNISYSAVTLVFSVENMKRNCGVVANL